MVLGRNRKDQKIIYFSARNCRKNSIQIFFFFVLISILANIYVLLFVPSINPILLNVEIIGVFIILIILPVCLSTGMKIIINIPEKSIFNSESPKNILSIDKIKKFIIEQNLDYYDLIAELNENKASIFQDRDSEVLLDLATQISDDIIEIFGVNIEVAQ